MQSFIKAALLISALAFVLTGCSMIIHEAEPVTNTYEFSKEITDILISTTACDVKILPSSDGKTTVICREADKLQHDVTLQNGLLKIAKKKTKGAVSFTNMTLEIELRLPEKDYNGLTVETTSGGITVAESFSCSDAELAATSGGISFSGKVTGKFYSDTSSGGQYLDGISCRSVKVTSTSGGIVAVDLGGGYVGIKSTSGNMELTSVVCEEMEAESTSGDIRFRDCDADSVTLTATSGDITGSLITGKRFSAKSGSGSISVPENSPGTGSCTVKTGSGDITISVNEKQQISGEA